VMRQRVANPIARIFIIGWYLLVAFNMRGLKLRRHIYRPVRLAVLHTISSQDLA
jgi:hypothetical protein